MAWMRFFMVIFTILLSGSSICVSPCFSGTFRDDQLCYERVRSALRQNEPSLKELFVSRGLAYPPEKIFIRIFKAEDVLELWAYSTADSRYQHVKSYNVDGCMGQKGPVSGTLGPKRQGGDYQIPEGFYHIDRFNPVSRFYLSLGINYPNRSDRILGNKGNPGSDIFIHGSCVTIGCIPIGNEFIKELYLVAVEARSGGQRCIPVHIFPTRLSDEGMEKLKRDFKGKEELISFWENLKQSYDYFEENRKLPNVSVDGNGRYLFTADGL